MGKKEEIRIQISEGKQRKKNAEEWYQKLLKKIEDVSPLPIGSDLARLVGTDRGVLSNRFRQRETTTMHTDLFLSLLLFCGAEIFFPGEQTPSSITTTEKDMKIESLEKQVKFLEKLVDSLEKNIEMLEKMLKIKGS